MKEYFISNNKSLLNTEDVWLLIKDYFWNKDIPIEYVERFIKYSLCFGVYLESDKKLIGFARVITDYTTYAYMVDVAIDVTHRRKGIATELVKTIMSHPELQGLRTWTLRSTEEARKIYEALGFQIIKNHETQLEIDDFTMFSQHDFINLHFNEMKQCNVDER